MAALHRATARTAVWSVCYAVALPQGAPTNRDDSNRIDDLRRVLGLVDDPDRLAMIIADARMVEDKIEELIDGNPLR